MSYGIIKKYENKVYTETPWDEKGYNGSLSNEKVGAKLPKLSKDQADYIGVDAKGHSNRILIATKK